MADVLRFSIDMALKVDSRVYCMRKLKSMGVSGTIKWLYPTMVQLDVWISLVSTPCLVYRHDNNRPYVFMYRIQRMGTTLVSGRLKDCPTQDYAPMAFI